MTTDSNNQTTTINKFTTTDTLGNTVEMVEGIKHNWKYLEDNDSTLYLIQVTKEINTGLQVWDCYYNPQKEELSLIVHDLSGGQTSIPFNCNLKLAEAIIEALVTTSNAEISSLYIK